jgi:hypothetical protein
VGDEGTLRVVERHRALARGRLSGCDVNEVDDRVGQSPASADDQPLVGNGLAAEVELFEHRLRWEDRNIASDQHPAGDRASGGDRGFAVVCQNAPHAHA